MRYEGQLYRPPSEADALVLPMPYWREVLAAARASFPNLRRVSCYAMAQNVTEKSDADLREPPFWPP